MDLLFKLLDAYGPSGNETEVRKIISKEVNKHADKVSIDKYGNLIACRKGPGPKVLLVAHMDEIGLMVKSISDRGIAHVVTVGWWDPISLVGCLAHLSTKKGNLHAIVTIPAMNNGEEVSELPKVADLRVDFGMNKKELQKAGVTIGSYLNVEQKVKWLNKKGMFTGKALDDRVGCFILLEVARKLKKSNCEIYFVFSVQEEIGLYGAKTSIYGLNPDLAIAVDVTNSDDMVIGDEEVTREVGKGPTITIKDSEMMANKCINDELLKISQKKKIPVQMDVSEFGTTDALSISLERGGIPTTAIGVPVRNLHTPMGIASFKDIEFAVDLLVEFLKNPPKQCYI